MIRFTPSSNGIPDRQVLLAEPLWRIRTLVEKPFCREHNEEGLGFVLNNFIEVA